MKSHRQANRELCRPSRALRVGGTDSICGPSEGCPHKCFRSTSSTKGVLEYAITSVDTNVWSPRETRCDAKLPLNDLIIVPIKFRVPYLFQPASEILPQPSRMY